MASRKSYVPLSRRDLCLAGLAVPLASASSLLFVSRADERKVPSVYHSSLVNGLTPKRVKWDGREWSADMGSTWTAGMEHCFQVAATSARFEIRTDENDRGENDDPRKRRSELHCTKNLLPNGTPLWGAMSFNHHGWADAAAMAKGHRGGVHGQVHMHKFGGSPAVAFRRSADGRFRVTTRGEFDPDGSERWAGPLSFDQVHDLVYRLLLHPTAGELGVWLDGANIVDVKGVSIGSSLGGCYWCVGCYYGGGVACPVAAEFANHVFFDTRDLSRRISSAPAWPFA
jgi:hypothetical protein